MRSAIVCRERQGVTDTHSSFPRFRYSSFFLRIHSFPPFSSFTFLLFPLGAFPFSLAFSFLTMGPSPSNPFGISSFFGFSPCCPTIRHKKNFFALREFG